MNLKISNIIFTIGKCIRGVYKSLVMLWVITILYFLMVFIEYQRFFGFYIFYFAKKWSKNAVLGLKIDVFYNCLDMLERYMVGISVFRQAKYAYTTPLYPFFPFLNFFPFLVRVKVKNLTYFEISVSKISEKSRKNC